MRVRGTVVGTVAALAGLVMSGCQSAVAGSPTVVTTQPDATGESSGVPPSTSERLAPSVVHPKDLRGIDPCELLAPEQTAELGLIAPGQKETSDWGETKCLLLGPVVGIGFSPNTTLGDGLDRAYRNKNNFDNFAESNVDGYPAVRVNFATQSCALIVGVSDEQTLTMELTRVSSDAPGRGDPCAFAESVAAEVMKNLPDA